jgi:predicted Zn-dependent protease
MWCLAGGATAPWADTQLGTMQPLAEEVLSLPITVRDHRDSIYRALMSIDVARNESAEAFKWSARWLSELDATKPRSDDERTALDIARVENVQISGDPSRILPALRESEKAMPNNYVASMRLAEMQVAAKQYYEAIATCRRGLARRPGAVGKAWLLQIEADALEGKGQKKEVRQVLQEALKAAEEIPSLQSRERTVSGIKKALEASDNPPR